MPEATVFEPESHMKVIVVGPSGAGKTSLLARYTQGTFAYNYKATIGCDFINKQLLPRRVDPASGKLVKLADRSQAYHPDIPHRVRLDLWDLAGQDRYAEAVAPMFCRNAVGALLVCDETSAESIASLRRYKQAVNRYATIPGTDGKPVPCVLAVTKHDLVVGSQMQVPAALMSNEISQLVEVLGIDSWFYTSSKTGEGVSAPFDFLVSRLFADPVLVEMSLRRAPVSPLLSPKSARGRSRHQRKSGCSCQ